MNRFLPGELVCIAGTKNVRIYSEAPDSAAAAVDPDNVKHYIDDDCFGVVVGWANSDYVLVVCSRTNTIGFVWKANILEVQRRKRHGKLQKT